MSLIHETHRRAVELLPRLKEAKVSASWAGYIDSTPDGVFLPSAKCPACRFSCWPQASAATAYGIGPGAGHLIADLITVANRLSMSRIPPERLEGSAWGKVAAF